MYRTWLAIFIALNAGVSSKVNSGRQNDITFSPYDGIKTLEKHADLTFLEASSVDPVRRQPLIPEDVQFPCPKESRKRSPVRPNSVHRLRPGDIDVIGAMGDSLIAGNGALEDFALGTLIEYRGVSWCAGGEGTWRQYVTLPNILKMFNPNMTGYSLGTGEFLSRNAQLNVAFPVSADADALKQAKVLVHKMKKDPRVDFKRDWKLVTLFFGANDLCSGQCYNNVTASPSEHARKLMVALDYLQANMPRTFVNLVPALDVSVSVRLKRSIMCRLLHRFFCMCFHQRGNEMDTITEMARRYQAAENYLVSSGRYNVQEDFTVVIQPFIKSFNAPLEPHLRYSEVIDISYITYDCFHFSQKGHALAANLLWNNMLEPVGMKKDVSMKHVMQRFYCPTEDAPYFFTYNNTIRYLQTGSQD